MHRLAMDAASALHMRLSDKIESLYNCIQVYQMMHMQTKYYDVIFYMNDELMSITTNLTSKAAYSTAAIDEARNQHPGSRWHIILRGPALDRLKDLLVGETLRVCWQDYNPELDTQHVLIIRNNFFNPIEHIEDNTPIWY